MKLSLLKQKIADQEALTFHVMTNPGEPAEWTVWVHEPSGKSYLLVNDDDEGFRSKDANEILALLKNLGVKKLKVSL